MAIKECTHFKVGGRWFFVGLRAKPLFIKVFDIVEALQVTTRGGALGQAISFLNKGELVDPIKLRSILDLYRYLDENNLSKQMQLAFSNDEIEKLQGKLLVKAVHG